MLNTSSSHFKNLRLSAGLVLFLSLFTLLNQAHAAPADDFVITVKTDNFGGSTENQFNIPTHPEQIYNYNVDCDDDGTNEATAVKGDYTCNYGSPGTFTIRIKDNTGSKTGFPHIYFDGQEINDNFKILSVDQWGTGKWKSMARAFYQAENLVIKAKDAPDLSQVSDMSWMFAETTSANQDIGNIGGWDTSNVTDMNHMFGAALFFNEDISGWDTSNVTDMSQMFSFAESFNQDISGWDTSKVLNMRAMFSDATSFDQDLSQWNVESVGELADMFRNTTLSTQNYDALLKGWSTQNLKKGVIFGAGNSTYCEGSSARNKMVTTYGWKITDGGPTSNCSSDPDPVSGSASITYSGKGFTETAANDGTVTGSIVATLTGDTFKEYTGELMVEIGNLPLGLFPVANFSNGNTVLTLTLEGRAIYHANENDQSVASGYPIEFNFLDTAFTNSDAADVDNATGPANSLLGIDFNNPSPNSYCAGYKDVPATHPSCPAIELVKELGLFTGEGNGSTLNPNGLLQRDHMAKIMALLLDFDENAHIPGALPFVDMNNQWSFKYVDFLYPDYTTGYQDGSNQWRPANKLNAYETLAFLGRAFFEESDLPDGKTSSVKGVPANQWFTPYVEVFANEGFVDKNDFDGNSDVTRLDLIELIGAMIEVALTQQINQSNILNGDQMNEFTVDDELIACNALPDDFEGLELWLRADTGVTEDMLGVAEWLDMGPENNDAFRDMNDNAAPELVPNAINGHPVMRFNENSRLFYPNLSLDDFTIFEVGKNNAKDEDFYMILGPAIGSNLNQQVRYEGSDELLLVGPGHGSDIGTYSIGNNKVYHSLTMDGLDNEWSVYRDGELKGTEIMDGQSTWQLGTIGAWFSKHWLNADIAELIIFDRSLDDSEREAVQCYLDQRYNLP